MQTNEPEPDNESEVPYDSERPDPGDGGPQFRVWYCRPGLSPEQRESLIPYEPKREIMMHIRSLEGRCPYCGSTSVLNMHHSPDRPCPYLEGMDEEWSGDWTQCANCQEIWDIF